MTKVFLAGFKAGKSRYEHTVDTDLSDTFVHAMDTGTRIYRCNEGGWVFNKHGNIAGRFAKMSNGCYFYKTTDSKTRINTKFSERMEAERDAFGVLLAFGYQG